MQSKTRSLSSIRIGIVTVSDRASQGTYADRSGPAIEAYLNATVVSPMETVSRLIADEKELITKVLIELCDQEGCALVLTTGGTGPAWRDVTPEATEAVCQKMMPGFGELMRSVSLQYVPTAILSRQTAGIRSTAESGSLIINLPGSPKAIGQCLDAVFPAVSYCLELINPKGANLRTDPARVISFRPGHASSPKAE